MYEVHLSESAFLNFQRKAQTMGLTIEEYLNEVGAAMSSPDEFVMTPEIHAGIERGLEQARRGEMHSLQEVRAFLDEKRKKWSGEGSR